MVMRVVGHRGNSAVAPQNTLAAFEAAWRAGADCVELDVQLTADGRVVVIHDDTVDATTDGTGPVAGFTLASIRRLDAGSWFSPAFADAYMGLLEVTVTKPALVTHDVEKILGRPPQSFADAVVANRGLFTN